MDKRLQRMEALIEQLNKHSYEYYVLDNPTIADKEYDKKYDELLLLEKETGIVYSYSPTARVGDVILSEFKKYTHKGTLWSLDKAQSLEEIKEWHNRNIKFVNEYNATHEEKLAQYKIYSNKKI